MKPVKSKIPIEIVELILHRIPHKALPKAMLVCKAWQNAGARVAYRSITFKSVKQREKLFSCLQLMKEVGRSSPRSSPTNTAFPPPVILRRSSSRFKYESAFARLIKSLDFGLQPKHLRRQDPELPMTKRISHLASPVKSPSSAMSLDSPTFASRIPVNSPSTSLPKMISPVRERVGASVLSVSTISIVSPTRSSKDDLKSPYGSWSHRFVSPLVPLIPSLIPNLQELSLCGCHVNSSDFGLMLSGLRNLIKLDVSYSTLKTDGIEMISRYCRSKLQVLDVSGIFKLGRNRKLAIISIAAYCSALESIIAFDCPELYEETIDECLDLCGGRIRFFRDLVELE